jgi:hypothetical protein
MPISSGRAFRSPPPSGFENVDSINHTKALLRKAHGELQSALREVQLARQEAKSARDEAAEAREEAAAAKRDRDALVREMELLHVSSACLEREVAALTIRLAEQYEQVVAKKSRTKRERQRLAVLEANEGLKTTVMSKFTPAVSLEMGKPTISNIVTPSWRVIHEQEEVEEEGDKEKEKESCIILSQSDRQHPDLESNIMNNANRINATNLSIVALNASSSVVNNTVDVSSVCNESTFSVKRHDPQTNITQPSTLLSPISKGRSDLTRLQKENERLAAAILETERKSPSFRPEANMEINKVPSSEQTETEMKYLRKDLALASTEAPWTVNSVLRILL